VPCRAVPCRVVLQSLVGLNFNQEAVEADMRYGLVRVRENAESIAFYGGQANEMATLKEVSSSSSSSSTSSPCAAHPMGFRIGCITSTDYPTRCGVHSALSAY